MSLSIDDFRSLHSIAIAAATRAGEWIAERRPSEVEHKSSQVNLASQVVTEVDLGSEEILIECLGPSLQEYDLGILSEERPDDGSRHRKEYFWCIDPLDGTLPYIENKPGYSVVIALVRRDGFPMLGVIYDIANGLLVSDGVGLESDFQQGSHPQQETLSVYFDRSIVQESYYSDLCTGLERISHCMGLSGIHVHLGAGAAMNACWALRQGPACYIKFPKAQEGGGCLWDFAAAACLFREAGQIASDIHGNALDLNRADSCFMNHRGVLFATDEALARQLRTLYREITI